MPVFSFALGRGNLYWNLCAVGLGSPQDALSVCDIKAGLRHSACRFSRAALGVVDVPGLPHPFTTALNLRAIQCYY